MSKIKLTSNRRIDERKFRIYNRSNKQINLDIRSIHYFRDLFKFLKISLRNRMTRMNLSYRIDFRKRIERLSYT